MRHKDLDDDRVIKSVSLPFGLVRSVHDEMVVMGIDSFSEALVRLARIGIRVREDARRQELQTLPLAAKEEARSILDRAIYGTKTMERKYP